VDYPRLEADEARKIAELLIEAAGDPDRD